MTATLKTNLDGAVDDFDAAAVTSLNAAIDMINATRGHIAAVVALGTAGVATTTISGLVSALVAGALTQGQIDALTAAVGTITAGKAAIVSAEVALVAEDVTVIAKHPVSTEPLPVTPTTGPAAVPRL